MRRAIGLVVAAICAATTSLSAVTPASAAPFFDHLPIVQVGYTDARHPHVAYDLAQADIPLGSWQDQLGRRHLSRAYVTFDLSGLTGRRVVEATLAISESWAADCAKHAIDVWRTEPVTATPSWRTAPAQLERIGSTRDTSTCPALVQFDVAGAVRSAVGHGLPRLTLEVRVPALRELDLSYGRRLAAGAPIRLLLGSNAVPTVDSSRLYTNFRHCTQAQPYAYLPSSVALEARGADADPSDVALLTAQFAIWPVATPEQVTTLEGHRSVQIPPGLLAEGETYAWRARFTDRLDWSDWSATCYFIVDGTRPQAAPAVSSPGYDPVFGSLIGGSGVFTFAAAGVPDVAGYQYSWGELSVPGCELVNDDYICQPPAGYVPATGIGGSSEVTLTVPGEGSWTLKVRSFDRAGNPSDTVDLNVYSVPSGPPGVTSTDYPEGGTPAGGVGVAGVFTFTPPEGFSVFGYVYILGDQYVEVPAEADGTATVSIAPTAAGSNTLTVAAVLSPTDFSTARHYTFTVAD